MFDPTIGRWLEEDPSSFAGGDANLYRYVGNDPTNATDPTGLAAMIDEPKSVQLEGSTIASGFELNIAAAVVQSVNITESSAKNNSAVSLALALPNPAISKGIQDFLNGNLPLDFKSVPPGFEIDLAKKKSYSGETVTINMNNLTIYVPAGSPIFKAAKEPFTVTLTGTITLQATQGWIAPAVRIPSQVGTSPPPALPLPKDVPWWFLPKYIPLMGWPITPPL